jgi:hypothetical protein
MKPLRNDGQTAYCASATASSSRWVASASATRRADNKPGDGAMYSRSNHSYRRARRVISRLKMHQ